MVKEIERTVRRELKERERNADALPADIAALSDRIERLRVRLADGDPDLESYEIGSTIEKAEAKLQELQKAQAAKARAIVRKIYGPIWFVPEGDALYAEFEARPAALLQKAVGTSVGSAGTGGLICAVPAVPFRLRLK